MDEYAIVPEHGDHWALVSSGIEKVVAWRVGVEPSEHAPEPITPYGERRCHAVYASRKDAETAWEGRHRK